MIDARQRLIQILVFSFTVLWQRKHANVALTNKMLGDLDERCGRLVWPAVTRAWFVPNIR